MWRSSSRFFGRFCILGWSGVNLVLPAGEALVAGDEARAAGEGEVGPDPGGEDRDAVAEADEEEDVDGEPCDPGGKAAQCAL